jgi:hypothetical protein
MEGLLARRFGAEHRADPRRKQGVNQSRGTKTAADYGTWFLPACLAPVQLRIGRVHHFVELCGVSTPRRGVSGIV